MSDSPVFEYLCEVLERASGLSRLEARGTVRLLLKDVGLDPALIGQRAALVAVDRLLEKALRTRGVREPARVKAQVRNALEVRQFTPEADSPEAIFERIGRR